MADDIFLTPEEQDERARQWLKDNGPALVIGVALGLAGIFGYEQYQSNKQTKAEAASALYSATLTEVNDSSLSDIDAQVTKLKADYASSSYAAKAALLKAKQLSASDLDAAYAELQWVVDNANESGLQHAARIRQAKIKLSQGEFEQAKTLASHTPALGFESNYAEILAEVSLKQGDEVAAREYFQTAIDTLPGTQSSYARVLSLKLDRLPAPAEFTTEDAAAPAVETPADETSMQDKAATTPGTAESAATMIDESVGSETTADSAASAMSPESVETPIEATVEKVADTAENATQAVQETVDDAVQQ